MPRRKKDVTKSTDPEACKEAGNKAFLARKFEEAVACYTAAIDLTPDRPNHVYFANRGNA
jgi:hypothetical protein